MQHEENTELHVSRLSWGVLIYVRDFEFIVTSYTRQAPNADNKIHNVQFNIISV